MITAILIVLSIIILIGFFNSEHHEFEWYAAGLFIIPLTILAIFLVIVI